MQWTIDDVFAFAPDAGTAKRARTLMTPTKWPMLEHGEDAVWGQCKGSGSQFYFVRIDLTQPTFKCSCPARKYPCKHVVGLLALFVEQKDLFQANPAPEWVQSWLEGTRAKAQKKAQASTSPPSSEKEAAQKKRLAQRVEEMQGGAADFRLWMRDLLEQGIVSDVGQNMEHWERAAARLVDAKMPRLATRLKEVAAKVGASSDWPSLCLEGLSDIHLLLRRLERFEDLTAIEQEDLLQVLGRAPRKADILSTPAVEDTWLVLSVVEAEDIEHRTFRHVWLYGIQTKRFAFLLDFNIGYQGYEQHYREGEMFKGALCFYPSLYPQRAVLSWQKQVEADLGELSFFTSIQEALDARQQVWLKRPWTRQVPVLLEFTHFDLHDMQLCFSDASGICIYTPPLSPVVEWQLLAMSGGKKLCLFGELDEQHFIPLSLVYGSNVVSLVDYD